MTAAERTADLEAANEKAAAERADAIRREHGPVPAELAARVAALLTPQPTRRAS